MQTQSVSPVFVGRAAELDALRSALSRAAAGEPQALLVGGEAGVGKTRLVEEFLAGARAAGAVVAVGGCVEAGADGLPFTPVTAVLRALHRALGDELPRAAAGREAELARLLPELADADPGRPERDGRAGLFDLTARLLERLAADRTLVVAVEDLHWADSSTRELLGYLLRSLHTGRLVVLATYRSDDIHRRHPLRPFLAELDRMRSVARVELDRFTRDETGAQIAGINGTEPAAGLVDRVYERSEGNAFFVEELTRSIAQGCSSGLTESLRDLLLVRVEALPEEAGRVVRILAQGGSRVEHGLLAAVSGLRDDDLDQALRVAVGAHIVAPTGDNEGYRFRHALVCEAVLDDLLPGERVRLNRRYAQALEADPGLVCLGERAARLAGYWYHAHDTAKAFPAVLAAADEARGRYAYAEELGLLERALELWDDTPAEVRDAWQPAPHPQVRPGGEDGRPGDYLDVLAAAVIAGNFSGRRERGLGLIKRALRLIDETAEPLRAAWFLVQRSKLTETLARGDGREDLDHARALVEGLPPSGVHALVLATAASWCMVHERVPEAFAAAEAAAAMARTAGAEPIALHARLTLGSLMVGDGDIDRGLSEIAAVRERARETGDLTLLSRAHTNYVYSLEMAGRSAEAVAAADAGAALHLRLGRTEAVAWLRGNQAESLLALGRWPQAREAALVTRRYGDTPYLRAAAAAVLALVALATGDGETAERELAAAREGLPRPGRHPQWTVLIRYLTLGHAAARHDLTAVRRILDEALEAGFPHGCHHYAWPLLHRAAEAESAARGLPAADAGRAAVLARLRAAAAGLARPVPLWEAWALLTEAEIQHADGTDTPEGWAAAVAAFEALDRPDRIAAARFRLAESLLTHGVPADRDRAAALLRLAHAAAADLGAAPLREDVAALARRARLSLTPAAPGAPAAPVAPVADFGLTPRERDVLRLVAAGRSNRLIAEELFISPKTASVHVSNILAKLDVSGRVEAAALAHRLGLFAAGPEAPATR